MYKKIFDSIHFQNSEPNNSERRFVNEIVIETPVSLQIVVPHCIVFFFRSLLFDYFSYFFCFFRSFQKMYNGHSFGRVNLNVFI